MSDAIYAITATPKILDRIYYAIQRCKERPDVSATSINAELVAQFGKSLAPTHWTIINAARRDNALDRISVKAFDFAKHGRKARLGKTKAAVAKAVANAPKRGRGRRVSGKPATTRLTPNPSRHPRLSIAVWKESGTIYHPANGRDEARKLVAKLLDEGVPLPDIAVYALEPLEVSFAIRL